jgi:hypothetical protein
MRARVLVVLAMAAFVACGGDDGAKSGVGGGGVPSGGKGGSGGKAVGSGGGGTGAAGDAGSANAGEGGEAATSGGQNGAGVGAAAGAGGDTNGGDTSSGGTVGAGAGAEAGAGGTGEPGITECAELAPLVSGTCLATAGDDGKLISGNILLPDEVLRGGQVLVNADGLIVCVGCDCSNETTATPRSSPLAERPKPRSNGESYASC